MSHVDLAIQPLEGAYGPWREHAWSGLKVGARTFTACAPRAWPNISALWAKCVPTAVQTGHGYFHASRERVPEYVFRILVEAGQRERAVALARERGWLRDGADYCRALDLLPVSGETTGLLAMLLQPDRADCLVGLGAEIADDGLARLGRLVLLDRVQNSSQLEARPRAEWVLRHRLPDDQIPKLAESRRVPGWRSHTRRRQPAEAREVSKKAIAAAPAFSWPYHNIGRLYMSQKDDEQALAWLAKALEVNPNHLRAQFNLGVAAARLNRYDEALGAYSRALVMNPADADAYANLGWILLKVGRQTEALALARRAADAAPTSVRALNARAGMAEFMGEFDEARTFHDRAGALAPDDPDTIDRTASFAVRMGEYDRALAQLDRLLALHPRHVRWLFQWAPTSLQASLLRDHPSLERIVQIKLDILTEKGDLEQARRMARAYAIVQPGQNYCDQARERSRAGAERDEIFKAFRLATLGQPDAADCIRWYGQWLSDEGYVRLGRLMVIEGTRVTPSAANKEGGARYVRIRLGGNREVPKRAEQLFLIARQRYLRDGDVDGAARLFDESIRLAPAFARPYNYRALIAADLGDREGALAWLQRALQADPDSWRTHRNLGRLFETLERYPEAEMHLRRTVQLFGDDAGRRP